MKKNVLISLYKNKYVQTKSELHFHLNDSYFCFSLFPICYAMWVIFYSLLTSCYTPKQKYGYDLNFTKYTQEK